MAASAFANNPVPTVVGPPVPQAVVPGSGAFTLKVYGANFVSGAVVNWNRSPRSTMFISARELQAQILASDVATATAGYITVTNPPPGGGVSSSSFGLVEVHTPTSTIVVKRPHAYLRNVGSQRLVLGDYNNDGILDFAADYSFSEIKILLGNGDGTFRSGPIATHNYYGSGPAAIASGDFNNDGNEDLAFGADPNGPPTQLQVSLGNGDGKFRLGSRSGHFDVYPFAIVAGDYNGDGKLDAIALEGGIYVFLGNGDGTFRRPLYDANVPGYDFVSADFNGDGILDLAILRETEIEILLGNGDGTFRLRTISIPQDFGCGFGPPILVTDFNADGKADLAYCERDQNNGKIWVLLGNGDGTFKKPVSYPIKNGLYSFSFAAGDFNSDGNTDLVVSYITFNSSVFELLLGKGDGTFQKPKSVNLHAVYNAEEGIVVGDFNSDGLLDFIFQQPGDVSVFTQK